MASRAVQSSSQPDAANVDRGRAGEHAQQEPGRDQADVDERDVLELHAVGDVLQRGSTAANAASFHDSASAAGERDDREHAGRRSARRVRESAPDAIGRCFFVGCARSASTSRTSLNA